MTLLNGPPANRVNRRPPWHDSSAGCCASSPASWPARRSRRSRRSTGSPRARSPTTPPPSRLAGLAAPVEIVRDNASVPHIFGETDADVFFGLGFAHAQDRLWQMTMLRRTAQGRLSELFGSARLDRRADAPARPLHRGHPFGGGAGRRHHGGARGLRRRRQRLDRRRSTRARAGAARPSSSCSPPEIAPWQPADCLAIVKLMALQLHAAPRARGAARPRVARAARGAGARHPARRAAARRRRAAGLRRALPRAAAAYAAASARRADPLSPVHAARLGGRLERLGRGALAVGRGRHAAGQRPAPRLHRALDLVPRAARAAVRRRDRRHDPGRCRWCWSGAAPSSAGA